MFDIVANIANIIYCFGAALGFVIGGLFWVFKNHFTMKADIKQIETDSALKIALLEKDLENVNVALNKEIEEHKKNMKDDMRIFWEKLDTILVSVNGLTALINELKGQMRK